MKCKFWAIFMALIFLFSITASAYSVGQTVHFGATSAGGSDVTGGQNTSTRSEEELVADSANLSATNTWSEIARTYITENIRVTNQKYVYDQGSIIIVNDDKTKTEDLRPITTMKDSYNDIGYYQHSYDDRSDAIDHEMDDADKEALMTVAKETVGDVFQNQVSEFDWNTFPTKPKDYTSLQQQVFQPESTYIDKDGNETSYGSRIETLPGGLKLVDFDTYEARLQALDALLTFAGSVDTIDTKYIIEIKCESTSDSALWSSVPMNWEGTDQTHFWQIECIESDVGYIPAYTTFGGKDLLYTFQQPGKYRVTSTQILQETYYEALTYSVNEYWVVASTGQLIWKNEANGLSLDAIDHDIPADQQNLQMVIPHALTRQGTSYYTALDVEVEITRSQMNQVFQSLNLYSNDFNTFRIY